jgi:uncharacterized protein YciI
MRSLLLLLTLLPAGLPTLASAQTPPGFSTYVVALVTLATGNTPAGTTMQDLQAGHQAHLTTMRQDGLLLASGAIDDSSDLRVVAIFRGDGLAEVTKRVAADPLVKAGYLKVALMPWLGPSGIGVEHGKWKSANPGAPIKTRAYQLVLMNVASGAAPLTAGEQRSHLLHLDAMAKAGKLAAAGPILEPGPIAGLFVFLVDGAEADQLVAADPLAKSGKLVPERHAWIVEEGVLPSGFKLPLP